MQTPLILTIDLGTTSTRAMLFDAAAKPVPGCVAQVTNRLRTTSDGGAEFDADHLFDTIVAAIDQLLGGLDDPDVSIAAVAMDTFVGNLLGVEMATAANRSRRSTPMPTPATPRTPGRCASNWARRGWPPAMIAPAVCCTRPICRPACAGCSAPAPIWRTRSPAGSPSANMCRSD